MEIHVLDRFSRQIRPIKTSDIKSITFCDRTLYTLPGVVFLGGTLQIYTRDIDKSKKRRDRKKLATAAGKRHGWVIRLKLGC